MANKRWESMFGGSGTENWKIWRGGEEEEEGGGEEDGDGRMNQSGR